MTYNYEEYKPNLLDKEELRRFLKVRDIVKDEIDSIGMVVMGAVMMRACGDTWKTMACVEMLVEIGEIVETTQKNVTWAQEREFIRNNFKMA